jgi:hypothetical protein
MRVGRTFVVLAVATLGLGLFIPTALAGKKKNTAVLFNSGSPALSGSKTVKARGSLKTSTACLVARGMKLFLTDASGAALATLDSKTTDSNGNWRLQGTLPSALPSGTAFFVQVKATKRTAGKSVCKAGLSPVVQLISK